DLSHIFFDAVWGMALAEILTGYAASLYPLVAAARTTRAAATPIALATTAAFVSAAHDAIGRTPAEVSAETGAVDLRAINILRQRMEKIELRLTINDLLILARCAHSTEYRLSPAVGAALDGMSALAGGAQLVQRIRAHLDEQRGINPALLIPMDASNADPRMRVFPATFRNPLPQLLPRLSRCRILVDELRRGPDTKLQREFDHERALLYADLRMFGALLQAFKQVTMRGESFTTASLRLMGHLPGLMQNLVDLIPQKIGILNEIIKGHEVFSNVGQVVATSTLTRFASARDDGTTKQLVWGIMSDASGQLYITLRDFRPHIGPLLQGGRIDLANALAQDYVDSYAATTNALVRSIQRVLAYK
ncbi:MAG TPA: hypothetical protein VFX76_06255, partial [Roseiflexaceae bacterium]|nr:hypothetical protein [Roseiflexaceae bacterium]